MFSVIVPPHAWARYQLVPRMTRDRDDPSPLVERDGQMIVAYRELNVIISPVTGMLQQITAHGEPLLTGPLAVTFSPFPSSASDNKPLSAPRT